MNNMPKYFIALLPPEPIFSQLEALKKIAQGQFQSAGALLSPAHLTLHMPFEWPKKKELQLIQALSTISFQAFDIRIEGIQGFAPRVIFAEALLSNALSQLREQIIRQMKQLQLFNESDNRRGFHPHYTIAFRDLKKQKYPEALAYFQQHHSFQVQFTQTNFSLLRKEEKHWVNYHTFAADEN